MDTKRILLILGDASLEHESLSAIRAFTTINAGLISSISRTFFLQKLEGTKREGKNSQQIAFERILSI